MPRRWHAVTNCRRQSVTDQSIALRPDASQLPVLPEPGAIAEACLCRAHCELPYYGADGEKYPP
jgi:hypothetical protein